MHQQRWNVPRAFRVQNDHARASRARVGRDTGRWPGHAAWVEASTSVRRFEKDIHPCWFDLEALLEVVRPVRGMPDAPVCAWTSRNCHCATAGRASELSGHGTPGQSQPGDARSCCTSLWLYAAGPAVKSSAKAREHPVPRSPSFITLNEQVQQAHAARGEPAIVGLTRRRSEYGWGTSHLNPGTRVHARKGRSETRQRVARLASFRSKARRSPTGSTT